MIRRSYLLSDLPSYPPHTAALGPNCARFGRSMSVLAINSLVIIDAAFCIDHWGRASSLEDLSRTIRQAKRCILIVITTTNARHVVITRIYTLFEAQWCNSGVYSTYCSRDQTETAQNYLRIYPPMKSMHFCTVSV